MSLATRPRTVAIVAGEASGDMLAAQLVQAVSRLAPGVRFVGIGGNRMQAAGVECLYPVERLAVRGYVEVLRHFFDIVGIRRTLRKRWLAEPPDMFVGVDAPDFNFSLEHALRRAGVPTVHFISPSIWAWRAERMSRIKAAVSHMLALFPFEAPLYEAAGVPVTFVGHPLADMLPERPDRLAAREQLRVPADKAVVALLPGSRVSEVKHLADVYVATMKLVAQRRRDVVFLAPMVNRVTRGLFEDALARGGATPDSLTLLFGHSHEALMAADVGLIASGTATLEAALLGCPMVITYKMPALTWRIMWPKRLLPYVGLPNVLAGEFVVPELLQDDATPENLAQALTNLLDDGVVRRRIEARFSQMRSGLRRHSADAAAAVLVKLLGEAG